MRRDPSSKIVAPPYKPKGLELVAPSRGPKASASTVEASTSPLAVGVDSLYLGYFSDGLGIDWEGLRYAKERLVASPGLAHSEIEFGGETFALHRSGKGRYTFRLSNKIFRLGLSERMHPRCHVEITSEGLWGCGMDGAVARFLSLFDTLGSKPLRHETISRVDAAFDFHVEARDFCREDVVSQAVKDAAWRENQTDQSFQFGKGDVVCRFYDKTAEIEQESGKDWMYGIWGRRENVWRVEFQVRGERLKQAGISTVDQLNAYLPSLIKHLARHYTSLRVPTGDSNRSRWPLHPLWRALIDSADQLTNQPEHPPPPLVVGTEYQLQRQLRSLYGQLKGLATTLGLIDPKNPPSLEELLNRLPHLLDLMHAPELWRADVIEKMRERELGL